MASLLLRAAAALGQRCLQQLCVVPGGHTRNVVMAAGKVPWHMRGIHQSAPRFAAAARAVGAKGNLKTFKPITPGLRHRAITDRSELWKGAPYRPLTKGRHRATGRNNLGRITTRHRGSGHKRRYREIDFKRQSNPYSRIVKEQVASRTMNSAVSADPVLVGTAVGTVERIEYDPNRSARIALVDFTPRLSEEQEARLHRLGGDALVAQARKRRDIRYMLSTEGMVAGAQVMMGPGADHVAGNSLPLRRVIPGTFVSNIELFPGRGGQLCRAAGTQAELLRVESDLAVLRLPSKDVRKVSADCIATIGQMSNMYHNQRVLGKAGAKRWLGIRPTVRGTAMNPIDHPHGGGNGKDSGGTKGKRTPWGKRGKFIPHRTQKFYNKHMIVSDYGDQKRKQGGPR